MTQHIHKMLKYEISHLFVTNEPKKYMTVMFFSYKK